MAGRDMAQRRDAEDGSEAIGPPTVLSLVAPPPAGARAQQLFAEARAISIEHLAETAHAMAQLRGLLESVGEASDLYVPGLQAFAARLAEDLFWRSKSFEALIEQQRAAVAAAAHRTR